MLSCLPRDDQACFAFLRGDQDAFRVVVSLIVVLVV